MWFLQNLPFLLLASLSLTARAVAADAVAESAGDQGPGSPALAPKVFIINLYDAEGESFLSSPSLSLTRRNITVPGLSPLFPDVHCNSDASVCELITGEGEINAASSITALMFSPKFDLRKSYFLIAGVGGVDPSVATIASVTFARFAVQVDLQYEFDLRDLPNNAATGYIPQGSQQPNQYPAELYGTEVFELNTALRDKAYDIVQSAKVTLNDTKDAQQYRALFKGSKMNTAATSPPGLVKCDSITSNIFYSGPHLNSAFKNYTALVTNGTGLYCMSQQEDNAILESIMRAQLAQRADLSRVILMRTASDFIVGPPTVSATDNLFNGFAGYMPALQNLAIAGKPIVDAILRDWAPVYDAGIRPANYVGDILGSLGGKPDFGPGRVQEPEPLTPLGRRRSVNSARGGPAMVRRQDLRTRRLPSMSIGM